MQKSLVSARDFYIFPIMKQLRLPDFSADPAVYVSGVLLASLGQAQCTRWRRPQIRSDSLDALRPIRRYFYVDGNIERGAAFPAGQNIVLNFSNFTGKEHLLRMLVDRIEKPGWRPAGCCWIYICQAAAGAPVSSSQAWRITRASSSIT